MDIDKSEMNTYCDYGVCDLDYKENNKMFNPKCIDNTVFHKRAKLAILPTLYSHIFTSLYLKSYSHIFTGLYLKS